MPIQNIKMKFILIGDTSVGKTAIVTRKNTMTFSNTFSSTIGVDFVSFTTVMDGYNIHVNVWDTGGQDRFNFIIRSYFKNVTGVMLVYDITNRKSYNNLQIWHSELIRYNYTNRIMMVGCKSDLATNRREVPMAEAQRYAADHDFLFGECSAKSGDNVDEIFNTLIGSIKDDIIRGAIAPTRENGITIDNMATFSITDPEVGGGGGGGSGGQPKWSSCCTIL
jgi:small GTP-binding protein